VLLQFARTEVHFKDAEAGLAGSGIEFHAELSTVCTVYHRHLARRYHRITYVLPIKFPEVI
jgi:hypothetical protein